MTLEQWAAKWHIHPAALGDLRAELVRSTYTPVEQLGESETAVQTRIRLEGSRLGIPMWRNNTGVAVDNMGVPVRYGLANDSPALNKVLKSSDLIGIRPVMVTHLHVGLTIGQFVAREAKHANWGYKGNEHEVAQRNFIELITGLGGDAKFASGVGTL